MSEIYRRYMIDEFKKKKHLLYEIPYQNNEEVKVSKLLWALFNLKLINRT